MAKQLILKINFPDDDTAEYALFNIDAAATNEEIEWNGKRESLVLIDLPKSEVERIWSK